LERPECPDRSKALSLRERFPLESLPRISQELIANPFYSFRRCSKPIEYLAANFHGLNLSVQHDMMAFHV
jgi:hypothetical protein